MLAYITRRFLILIPLLFVVSLISFFLIELPPGDFVTMQVSRLRASGAEISQAEAQGLYERYGLNQPIQVRYLKWVGNLVQGRLGTSFQYQRPNIDLLLERLPTTIMLTGFSLLIAWAIAIPVGIYSATHKYSFFDYLFSSIGFVWLATPGFLLAMVLAWISIAYFNQSSLGLIPVEFIGKPWSWDKVATVISRLWLPVMIIGLGSTAVTIRVMRNNLLDELNKPYVVTARAKGLPEWQVLLRYPVRLALNPILSSVGYLLPALIAEGALVSIVMNLETIGPLLLGAILQQDMYLAGSILMILSFLTMLGTLMSDLLLAWADPRIRYEGGGR